MAHMTLPPEIAALRPTLDSGLAELALDPALSAPLLDYLALLARWNRTYNLTAVRDPAKMVTLHLLDSLAMHGQLQPGALADLGTGPGLPGIPLALARPDVQVTLVESNGKKARFLREAVRSLGIANARVLESRAEAVAEPGAYRQITARALATLAGILEVGGHLLAPDGVLLAMKSGTTDEEGRDLPPGWAIRDVHPLRVPGLDARRELVVVGRA
ncbi:MAG: 16S rRNA (guanine(527)-N(7))-methyltransferase RsmG [Proteobacteria bacterium]|nr:16S rRNA (guanine(527)-N(7))-methyltransferase RsmG [Pseudomonadota bacterium]MBS0217827.1 16S rRNA (guanine(527)-N(7))-methyltransferase RsmG [Pseudomonadota bacterium]